MFDVNGAGTPSRSQIEGWDATHLEAAATHWSTAAEQWEWHFTAVHNGVLSPGGTAWEGAGAEAAQERAWADLVKVRGLADSLGSASSVARNGADDLVWLKGRALDAIAEAEEAGFTVGEYLSVTDRSMSQLFRVAAERQAQAEEFAAQIGFRAKALAAFDKEVAGKITAALAPLGEVTFAEAADSPAANHGDVQAVDYKTAPAQEPSEPDPTLPVRGLPPADVRPPADGPLTDGPASRARERRFGGRSLWDEHGGEWRYFPGDDHHNPHWDYNPHSTPSGRGSDWQNIPIGDLPPRIGVDPSIISGLPPWLQSPALQAAPVPAQNPLLAPFPGASMPAAPPAASPAPGPSLMPHISIPAPNPGDLQNAAGQTAVIGGGGLLLALLGAMALG